MQSTKQTKQQKKDDQVVQLKDWSEYKFFDVAANLSDDRYKGVYHGKKIHDPDFDNVIERAQKYGVKKFLFAAGYIHDAEDSYNLSLKSKDFYCTIGIHPCRANEPFHDLPKEADQAMKEEALQKYYAKIEDILNSVEHKDKFVAIGECGLDYDRFEYADQATQHLVFPHHFDLAQKYNLPMYLHSRSTKGDFPRIVKENRHKFTTGVVHSYTGDLDEMKQLVEMGLFIGINGCSLKTQENLDVVKQIPLDRIMLETDCPYCDIRNSHASAQFVKTTFQKVAKEKYTGDKLLRDRNEPCTIVQVCEVVAALLGKTEKEVSEISWENTIRMFNLKE